MEGDNTSIFLYYVFENVEDNTIMIENNKTKCVFLMLKLTR
jgi:hypothetical protein